ncbi:hypothetical protein [uncultured Tenacibaculum sp.]|uniref:hypothetical protein n=1 Tax=uncultured Tenacibaculum sp. TaxID=174713 RepID=UPI00260ADDA0|nr:hypothetical protein [uncultured Tenacibaculum sp.]
MNNINSIIKKAQDDLFPQLEAKIRAELEKKDKDWLIDQIIFLTCEKHSLHEQKHNLDNFKKRLERIHTANYNLQHLDNFIKQYQNTTREVLEKNNLLINPPHMGLDTISSLQRSSNGDLLLEKARDVLYSCLYGDESINIHLTREQEEILTIMLPVSKSDSLFFLKAVTEVEAKGTWLDPEGISNDQQTPNHKLQIEFSNDKNGTIGLAALVALKLINFLHVNEQILYCYLEKLERSSLETN